MGVERCGMERAVTGELAVGALRLGDGLRRRYRTAHLVQRAEWRESSDRHVALGVAGRDPDAVDDLAADNRGDDRRVRCLAGGPGRLDPAQLHGLNRPPPRLASPAPAAWPSGLGTGL